MASGVVPPLALTGIVGGSGVPNRNRSPPVGSGTPIGVLPVVVVAAVVAADAAVIVAVVAAFAALMLLLLFFLLLLLLLHLYLLFGALYALRCRLMEDPSWLGGPRGSCLVGRCPPPCIRPG